jgi:hypothetical protein
MRHDADEFTMMLDTSNIWVFKGVCQRTGLHILLKHRKWDRKAFVAFVGAMEVI